MIKKGIPPNFAAISNIFPVDDKTVYAYFPDIYSNYELTPDLILHEEVHLKVQEQMGVENWWKKYLEDPQFRFEQEVMAYATQYLYCKRTLKRKDSDAMLTELSMALSSPQYGSFPYQKCESMIRLKAKQYATT